MPLKATMRASRSLKVAFRGLGGVLLGARCHQRTVYDTCGPGGRRSVMKGPFGTRSVRKGPFMTLEVRCSVAVDADVEGRVVVGLRVRAERDMCDGAEHPGH